MTRDFEGRVVAVSGAGGGLGRETSLRFARRGAVVHGSDINEEEARKTAELVEAEGGRMHTAVADLGDPEAVQGWIEGAARESGRLDVLVNNASAARFASLESMTVDDWRFTLRNELDNTFYGAKFAWPFLKAQGGVIVNIASVAGHRASRAAGNTAHSATKAAILAMTRQWAIEGAPHGIRVLSISPGFILTPGTAPMVADPEMSKALNSFIPVGRPGLPPDIAAMIVFAASDEASYLTGSDILIDGGMTA